MSLLAGERRARRGAVGGKRVPKRGVAVPDWRVTGDFAEDVALGAAEVASLEVRERLEENRAELEVNGDFGMGGQIVEPLQRGGERLLQDIRRIEPRRERGRQRTGREPFEHRREAFMEDAKIYRAVCCG